MKGIITVDIGTTNTRAILYDADACPIHTDQRETIPEFYCDGRVEQDSVAWQTILPSVLKGCAEVARVRGIEPVGVAVTAQRSSVIPELR
jgi:glycerol kinase